MAAAEAGIGIAERFAIVDLLNEYAAAVDARDWKRLEERVFAPDVECRYAGFGEFRGRDAVLDFLRESMAPVTMSQHVLSNHVFRIAGERAETRVYLLAHLRLETAEGERRISEGGVYEHELLRGAAGWRIHRLVLESLWRTEETGPVPSAPAGGPPSRA